MRFKSVSIVFASMGLFVALLLLYLNPGTTQLETPSNILMISVIIRHGDRTPTDTYPNDPHINYQWPDGWGALTNIGKNQLYNGCGRLRTYYKDIIKSKYSSNDVYVRTSDADRCHMSALACMAALYPPKNEQIWNKNLLWQPIPVHSEPRNIDETLGMTRRCKRYDQELSQAYQSEDIKQINTENADLYNYTSTHAGKNYTTITDIEFLHTTLEIEERYGLKLPDWTHTIYPNRTLPLMKRSLAIFSYSQFMRRIRGGSFLKEVINNMILKRDNKLKPNRSAYIYMAHDITLVHIFRTLGFDELMKPEYGAMLTFELHSSEDNNDQVQLKYFNRTDQTEPTTLTIPNCSTPCKLNDFVHLLASFIPTDFDEECKN